MLLVGYLLTRAAWGDPFERVDRELVRWLAAHRTPVLDSASAFAGRLGNTTVVICVGIAAAIAAGLVQRRWRAALAPVVALGGELAIFLTTTAVIDRPRPPVHHLDAHLPPTSSFPSGHTAAAICLYGVLAAVVLAETRGRWRVPVVCVAALVVVAVAASRLYRGAHYPTDVIGSALFALPWLLLTLRMLPVRRPAAQERVIDDAGKGGRVEG